MRSHSFILSAAAISLCLGLSSCGIYSKYHAKDEVADDLFGQDYASTDGDTTTIADIRWQELFTDSYLQGYIRQALEQNTDYLTALEKVKEAEATLLSAKLAYLPSLAFSPTGTASSWNHGKATQTYSIPVTASWEIGLFGSLRNARKQSKALLAQSKDYEQAVHAAVISNVANIYYTLLMLDDQLRLTQESEKAWSETVRSARALMAAGQYNEAGVAQLEASWYSVQTSVADMLESINQTENAFALILAETPRHYERGTLANQQFTDRYDIGVPLQILRNRPDVRQAERALEAAFYSTNSARSALYPNITLSGSAGWSNSSGSGIVNPGKLLASATASLTQPLFQQGKLLGQLKIAKAQQEEARLAFEQTVLEAGSEVNDALTALQTARAKTDLLRQQVEALDRALRSTSLLMEYGSTTYLEVLTARQTLLSAQLSETANKATEIQSLITLYQALGGGGVD